jgi:hypothetical protein
MMMKNRKIKQGGFLSATAAVMGVLMLLGVVSVGVNSNNSKPKQADNNQVVVDDPTDL